MLTIGIRELRQHASRYLRLVRSGQRVAVTDRGTLVAYLVPAGSSASILDRLEAAGDFTPAVGGLLDLPAPSPAREGGRPLTEVLAELRDEERW
jgi:prevent-host-death family protein